MKDKEIITIIKEQSQVPSWCLSSIWIKSLSISCSENYTKQDVVFTHKKKYLDLENSLVIHFINFWKESLNSHDISELVKSSLSDKIILFDPTLFANEKTFMKTVIKNDLIDFYNKRKLNVELKEGDLMYDISTFEYTDQSNFQRDSFLDLFMDNTSSSQDSFFRSYMKYYFITNKEKDLTGKELFQKLLTKRRLGLDYILRRDSFFIGYQDEDFKEMNTFQYNKYYSISNVFRRMMMDDVALMILQSKEELNQKLLYPLESYGYFLDAKKVLKSTPLLGAVVVDQQERKIKNQAANYEQINKITNVLFNGFFPNDFWKGISDCIVYLSHEPAYLPGNNIENKTNDSVIVPCCVKFLEAGIDEIHIAHLNLDQGQKSKGINVLETGQYKFERISGTLLALDSVQQENFELLIDYFELKNYPCIVDTPDELIYQIATPVKVFPFDIDIAFKIIRLNQEYLFSLDPDAFIDQSLF